MKTFLSIIVGSLVISPNIVALANSWAEGYTPPEGKEKTYQRRSSSSGGSRSFCEDPFAGNILTLVVPEAQIVHETKSSRPPLLLHSEGVAETKVIFTLVDPQKTAPLVERAIAISQPGFHRLQLPSQIELEEGKVYSWFIAIPCSNNPDKFREVLKASIKYVPVSASLQQKLQNTSNSHERAQILQKNGMWYDFIALKIKNENFALISSENKK